MKQFIAVITAVLALAGTASVAQANTTASFNGCVYHTDTYLQAVESWWADGSPTCGAGYVTSVSVDNTVSGTVEDEDEGDRSSWGRE